MSHPRTGSLSRPRTGSFTRPRTGSFTKSSATVSTPRKIGNVVDKATVIQRSFSCRSRREEESSPNSPSSKTRRNEETNSSTPDNNHWSKIRRMTNELYFSKQMKEHLTKMSAKQAVDKNDRVQSLKKDNKHFHARSKSPAGTKDSKHWSKVRTMTKAGFFSAAKIIAHPPSVDKTYSAKSDSFPTNKGGGCGTQDNSTQVSARQSNTCNEKVTRTKSAFQKDRSWKPLKNEVIVDKALKGILKEKYSPRETQTTNIKYIDIDSGKHIIFRDLVRSRRISSASDSSRSTFNDEEGRPKTSYTVGQESKFINTVNVIQKFDVPKKELQTLNMKKMTPFKYVYVLSKCLPQFICKNYRPTSIPTESDPLYNQRLHENRPPSSRPSTPASPTPGVQTIPEPTPEQNIVSA